MPSVVTVDAAMEDVCDGILDSDGADDVADSG